MPSRSRTALPKEVFLSHSKRDRSFAERLLRLLRSHGIRVWYSPRTLVPAQKWHSEIGRALGRCDWFIVVLSRNAVKSEWVERELVYALNHSQYRRHIVPVLKELCDFEKLSWTLGGFQFADFTAEFETGCRNLLRTWGLEYKPPRKTAQKRR